MEEKEIEERLQKFIAALGNLGSLLKGVFESGRMDIKVLEKMNAAIEEMEKAEQGADIEEFNVVREDCRAVYYNFNAIVSMIESQESRFMDNATMKAVNIFLKNVNASVVNIASAYGMV